MVVYQRAPSYLLFQFVRPLVTNVAIEKCLFRVDFLIRDGYFHTYGSVPDRIWLYTYGRLT